MFRNKSYENVGWKTYIDWFLLAFLAGSVNTGGYLACHCFVSHVTGFATLAGIDAAGGKLNSALGILTVPVYFLFGVMVSAYFTDRRVHEGKHPRYAFVMGLVTLLLVIAGGAGILGWFGKFGAPAELNRDYFFLALLCAASGLQNAALTSASGATIRTTHLTGITTDLGIGLIRAASYEYTDPKRQLEIKANFLRSGTIFSFMIGSGSGAFLFLNWGYTGFVLPAGIAAYATYIARRDERAQTQEVSPRAA